MENRSVIANEYLVINKTTHVYEEDILPKGNQETNTSMIRKKHATMTPYLHPNHKNQSHRHVVIMLEK
jgi:hypothetical protein